MNSRAKTSRMLRSPSGPIAGRELGRNPALLAVCGFDPRPRQSRPRRVVERVEGGFAGGVLGVATTLSLSSARRLACHFETFGTILRCGKAAKRAAADALGGGSRVREAPLEVVGDGQ